MSLNEKRMLDREALRSVIQQWNANRLDLFELSEPNEVIYFFANSLKCFLLNNFFLNIFH